VCERLLSRIATDENLHMVFYRNLVSAAMEVAPGPTMRAIADEMAGFEMPGAVIPGFTRKAAMIAQAGIYDLRIHHDEIVQPLLRHWRVFDIEGLDADGERARDELAATVAALGAQATRFEEQRARTKARVAARQG
jgi:acyl-[acyl-carrier-protein] desaturase